MQKLEPKIRATCANPVRFSKSAAKPEMTKGIQNPGTPLDSAVTCTGPVAFLPKSSSADQAARSYQSVSENNIVFAGDYQKVSRSTSTTRVLDPLRSRQTRLEIRTPQVRDVAVQCEAGLCVMRISTTRPP